MPVVKLPSAHRVRAPKESESTKFNALHKCHSMRGAFQMGNSLAPISLQVKHPCNRETRCGTVVPSHKRVNLQLSIESSINCCIFYLFGDLVILFLGVLASYRASKPN